jgi:hypothetical protein
VELPANASAETPPEDTPERFRRPSRSCVAQSVPAHCVRPFAGGFPRRKFAGAKRRVSGPGSGREREDEPRYASAGRLARLSGGRPVERQAPRRASGSTAGPDQPGAREQEPAPRARPPPPPQQDWASPPAPLPAKLRPVEAPFEAVAIPSSRPRQPWRQPLPGARFEAPSSVHPSIQTDACPPCSVSSSLRRVLLQSKIPAW